MTNDLPFAEWVFILDQRTHLKHDLRDAYWIEDCDIRLALHHEIDRECQILAPSEGGRGLTGKEFEEFIATPFTRLSDSQLSTLRNHDKSLDVFGRGAVRLMKGMSFYEFLVSVQVENWKYPFYVNWHLSDNAINESFAEFVRKHRPKNTRDHPKSGRRPTERDELKYIGALRLHRHYSESRNLDRAMYLIGSVLSETAPENASYSSKRTLAEAAKKGRLTVDEAVKFFKPYLDAQKRHKEIVDQSFNQLTTTKDRNVS